MCPCNLADEFVCSTCTAWLEERILERRRLEAMEQTCSAEDYDRLRFMRGVLHQAGLKTAIVTLRMEQRAWEARSAR